jgi:two-component system chemotaxis sensor kinase CheA
MGEMDEMDEMAEALETFIAECRELLEQMEDGLLQLETRPDDAEAINAVFRAAHTIKGSAGVFGFDVVVRFTHAVENLLDEVRAGQVPVSAALVAELLRCRDHIEVLVERLHARATDFEADLLAHGEELTRRLQSFRAAPAAEGVPAERPARVEGGGAVASDTWHISVRFGRDVLRHGMDPLSFLRYLATLGEVTHVTTLPDALPELAELDPESCYLGLEIDLRSAADKARIEATFDFVRDECELHILPPHSRIGAYVELIGHLPEEPMRLGEILVRSGALTPDELDQCLRLQEGAKVGAGETVAAPPLGAILVAQQLVQPELVVAAAARQQQVAEKKSAEARLIRVQADKLDQLIDLVGELVIAGASANLLAQQSGQGALVEATSVLSRLVENIRDSALQLRMVQIGETFNRFQRVVRDMARELDKTIELDIRGAETELDKSVVEKIGDPLMHLVRNAIDHGIEPAELRQARGKPAVGRLGLNAHHDSGAIVIEVTDDGGGLDRERIRAKAVERGLIAEGQALVDHELINLIFEPGFSTAEQVTNLSGRGVGMDVVRRNIQALRGTVDAESAPGAGACFRIRLPLTLAIIDGFLVGVERASYVIPLELVVECLELQDIAADAHYLNLRGEVLPFVRLRELFEVAGERPRRENVVVVKSGGLKAGIVVDVLHGEFQTVIKPLGALFRHLRGIAGSTILGSGDVAVIVDVPALVQLVTNGAIDAPPPAERRALLT